MTKLTKKLRVKLSCLVREHQANTEMQFDAILNTSEGDQKFTYDFQNMRVILTKEAEKSQQIISDHWNIGSAEKKRGS
jgi:hypothetical protein